MDVAGLLLTGGESRRLGVPKATLRRGPDRLVDRAERALTTSCRPVLEVGPGYGSLPTAREDPPGGGPLAALVAGSEALTRRGADGAVIALAVDLPGIPPALVAWLASHPAAVTVLPVVDGHPQTLCARYSAEARAVAGRLLAEGARSLRALVETVDVVTVGPADWRDAAGEVSFADVDTPADAARAGIEMPG